MKGGTSFPTSPTTGNKRRTAADVQGKADATGTSGHACVGAGQSHGLQAMWARWWVVQPNLCVGCGRQCQATPCHARTGCLTLGLQWGGKPGTVSAAHMPAREGEVTAQGGSNSIGRSGLQQVMQATDGRGIWVRCHSSTALACQ